MRDSKCVNVLSGTAAPLSAVEGGGLEEPVFVFDLVPVGPDVLELFAEEPTVTTPFGVTPEEEFDGVAEPPEVAEEPEADWVAAERT